MQGRSFVHHWISGTEIEIDVIVDLQTTRDGLASSQLLYFRHRNRSWAQLVCPVLAQDPTLHDRRDVRDGCDVVQLFEIRPIHESASPGKNHRYGNGVALEMSSRLNDIHVLRILFA